MAYTKRPVAGQATMANSEPVVIASDQNAIPVLGTVTANIGTVATLATAAKQDTGNTSVASIDTKTPALGQALAAASVPVILPAATVTTLTPPAAITGFGTAANQTTIIGHVDGIETLLTTIEGDTSAIQTAVQLLDDTVATLGTDTYTEATTKGLIIGAVRRDANTSLANTTNEVAPLQVNATGELKVAQIAALPAGTNNIGDVDVLTVITGTGATNLGKARDSAIGGTDTGIAMLGVRRDAPTAETPIAGDYIIPQFSANGEAWVRTAGELADDAAFTVATTRVQPVGFLADETATDSVDEGDAGAARMTLDRKQIVTTYAHAAGGATPYKLVSAATTNATSVKASAGTVYMITASNVNAAVRYLKLYNKASAPTVGTDVPVLTFIIPGGTTGAGTNIPIPNAGINFSTGIAFALTTEITDVGSTGVAVSEIGVNLAYI